MADSLQEAIEHIPATPPEPPVCSVRLDYVGRPWGSDRDGYWWPIGHLVPQSESALTWVEFNDKRGPLTEPPKEKP